MKYSYNWLKELSDTKLTAEQVAQALTMHSFEVESVENVGSDLAGVVVGEILAIAKHPNADKLQLTKVNIGKEILDIVCGANNISVGDKVPVAIVGTKLPNGIEIKEAEIRGEKSHGMLCAADELGLGTDHSGIILLDKKAKVGSPAGELLSERDTILEIKILPDRAHDALSHVGLAREISAIGGSEIDYDYEGLILPKAKSRKVSVKIEKSEICQRYIATVLENVKIGQSPAWLKSRLENCGIRSINNVVDVTNFVMLEIGQPMHAFDAEKIDAEIIIRKAKKGEKITILDASEKELEENDILIATKKEAIALAGVMGGLDSGVNENTKTIVLESATFNPAMIRQTKNRLNLLTDAAQRFEKGIDPNLAEKAMVRAIEILEHIAEAQLEGIVDEYPKKKKTWTIKLEMEYVEKLLGEKIPSANAKKILKSLGFGIRPVKSSVFRGAKQFNGVKGNEEIFEVEVPTFRLDTLTQEDLIEEIGRVYGYEKIKPIAPMVPMASPKMNEKRTFERNLKNILTSQGFSEVLNYAFYGKRDAEFTAIKSAGHLELEMPLTPEHAFLRVSLIPNLLKNVAENLKREKNFLIFEFGRAFLPSKAGLPEEKNILLGAVVIDQKNKKKSADKREESPFFEAKGLVSDALAQLGISGIQYKILETENSSNSDDLWHQSRSAEIKMSGSGEVIGRVGEVNPFALASFGIETRVALFEFDTEILRKIFHEYSEYKPLQKFPIVSRDISMIVKKDVQAEQVLLAIQEKGGKLVLDVELFDMFDLADGGVSFAFRILLGARDRTLTSAEVDACINAIIAELEKNLGVEVRK